MKQKRRLWALAAAIMAIVVVLSAGVAYARYMDKTSGSLSFRIKGLPELEMAQQEWKQVGEQTYALTFRMKNAAENCVIFLAMSEGISAPEQIQVYLTLPGGVTLQATGEAIFPESNLYSAFGGGYVFRFLDGASGQERILDLTTQEYVLNVVGLASAAEEISLLRVFIEYAE